MSEKRKRKEKKLQNKQNTGYINVGQNAVKGSSHILHEFRFHAMDSYQTGPAVVIATQSTGDILRTTRYKKCSTVVMQEIAGIKRLGTGWKLASKIK